MTKGIGEGYWVTFMRTISSTVSESTRKHSRGAQITRGRSRWYGVLGNGCGHLLRVVIGVRVDQGFGIQYPIFKHEEAATTVKVVSSLSSLRPLNLTLDSSPAAMDRLPPLLP